ncbi:MAG: hypothetical protein HKM02_03890 [Pseudomonadales bacterium]|nr:hypothetical protein [Pseudomonadales bacterium]
MNKSLIQQLQSNLRLRMGLASILVILWGYMLMVMHDAVMVENASYKQVLSQVSRVKGLIHEKSWINRAKNAAATRSLLEAALPAYATFGLAQAGTQEWIHQQLIKASLMQARITMAENSDLGKLPPDIWMIKAKIEMPFQVDSLNKFLANLQTISQPVNIESLHITQSGQQHIDMTLAVYCRKGDSASRREGL